MPSYRIRSPDELFFVRGHAVVSDYEIIGITQALDHASKEEYGHYHFVAEGMTRAAAEALAKALGKELT